CVRAFFAKPAPLLRFRFLHRRWHRGRFLFFRCRLFRFGLLKSRGSLPWFWFGFFPFPLLFPGRFFFDDLCCIDPLDECHGSGVALALAELHNARVTAVALRRSWRDVVEQSLYDSLLPQCRECGPARMNRSLFSERNHLFRERS